MAFTPVNINEGKLSFARANKSMKRFDLNIAHAYHLSTVRRKELGQDIFVTDLHFVEMSEMDECRDMEP
jgi:hypothetical protein